MAVSEIYVHPTDQARVDIMIPGEQHFSLKCPSQQERQQWVVALGSAKACLTSTTPHYNQRVNPLEKVQTIKSKRSELRLYCDLLMQQVQAVKETANITPLSTTQLQSNTSLLSETCDTLLNTLDECMRLVESSVAGVEDSAATTHHQHHHQQQHHHQPYHQNHHVITTTPVIPPTLLLNKQHSSHHRMRLNSTKSDGQPVSPSSPISPSGKTTKMKTNAQKDAGDGSKNPTTGKAIIYDVTTNDDDEDDDDFKDACDTGAQDTGLLVVNSQASLIEKSPLPSFFTEMKYSFIDLQPDNTGYFSTNQFLSCYTSLITLFDLVASSGLAPIKTDITSNLKSVRQKFECNEEMYKTLQGIVLREVTDGTVKQPQSATNAILWLKRSLSFIREMLYEVMLGQCEFGDCVHNAYCKTIKPYHGSVLRAAFTMAMKSVPIRGKVISSLMFDKTSDDEVEKVLMSHIECYITSLDRVVSRLHEFYATNSLDNQNQAGSL